MNVFYTMFFVTFLYSLCVAKPMENRININNDNINNANGVYSCINGKCSSNGINDNYINMNSRTTCINGECFSNGGDNINKTININSGKTCINERCFSNGGDNNNNNININNNVGETCINGKCFSYGNDSTSTAIAEYWENWAKQFQNDLKDKLRKSMPWADIH